MAIQILEKYLRPSKLCDFDKEIVRKKAEEIISGAKTDREKTERILDYCQNKILFAYGNWNEKASEGQTRDRLGTVPGLSLIF
jgi:transglutaminase-like putative cysteine protease